MNRNRSLPFLNNLSNRFLVACLGLLLASIAFWTSPVHAQTSTALNGVTVSSPTTAIAPTPAPIGLNVTGGSWSSGIGQAYNVGGDPTKGTSVTLSDGFFRLGTEAYLTGNSNGGCTPDCRDTQAKMFIIGEHITGARSTNEGNGTPAAPVVSVSGTNSSFGAGLRVNWNATLPIPAPATATSGN